MTDELRRQLALRSASPVDADRIVTGDLVPAIDGMLLIPVDDPDELQTLMDEAAGRGAMR